MADYPFRRPELEQFRSIWLTKKAFELLREEKKKQKLSLAKILDNLILEKYEKRNRGNDKKRVF